MRIAILGFGKEGKSVLKFIKKSPRFKNAEIEILDKKFYKHYLKNLARFDLIFRSPGIPYNLPQLTTARAKGVRFSSATKLFFDHCPATIIGVTGTKGKGTTATLLYKILEAARKRAFLAGNIGTSPLAILPKLKRGDYVVLELSSFQLHDLGISPKIAVVLDVFPDHQDSHLNLKEYYEAKTNIARHQKKNGTIFFFKSCALSRWVASKSKAKKIPVDEKQFALFVSDDLNIKGMHNFKNAVMAATIAMELGIPERIVFNTVKKFRGLEHRLELVHTIRLSLKEKKSHSYVLKNVRMRFYNDSASTNPQTTIAAIRAFPREPKILIMGGQDKGLDYRPVAKALSAKGGSASGEKNSNTKLVILFGENKKKIYRAIKQSGVPIKLVSNLKAAVQTAYRFTRKQLGRYQLLETRYQILVLFSPGAASFDQFKNYADRGTQFKKLVKNLGMR